jgi:hypothetical protein
LHVLLDPDCLRYPKSDIFFGKITGQLETKLGIDDSGEVPYKLNITFVDLKLKMTLTEDGTFNFSRFPVLNFLSSKIL